MKQPKSYRQIFSERIYSERIYSFIAVLICLCTVLSSCVKSAGPQTPGAFDSEVSSGSFFEFEESEPAEESSAEASRVADVSSSTASVPAKTTSSSPAAVTPIEPISIEAQEVKDLPPPEPPEEPGTASDISGQITKTALSCTPGDLTYTPVQSAQYYAYNRLNSTQKAVYAKMRTYAESMLPGGYLDNPCRPDDLSAAFIALLTDYPQFFWMSRGYIYGQERGSPRMLVYFQLDYIDPDTGEDKSVDYLVTKQQAADIAAQMRSKISGIFSSMPPAQPEFEQELFLHDWICANTEYENRAVPEKTRDQYMYAFSSYGVFVNGLAVCEGYSRAFQLLLYYAGIENTLVTGNTLKANGTPDYDGNHMWSMVKMNGIWGYTDITWNDNGIRPSGTSRTAHRWFNIPEIELQVDHYIDNPFSLPSAVSFDAAYCAVKGQMLTNESADEFAKKLIVAAVKEGGTYLEVLCQTPNAIDAQTLTEALNMAAALAEINTQAQSGTVSSVTVQKHSRRYYLIYWT